MKRILPLLLCLLLVFACKPKAQDNVYHHAQFTVALPEHFEPVKDQPVLCFAPYGDPLRSSSITYYATELNPYFEDFSKSEYEQAMRELCGYESLTLETIESRRVDGFSAKRIACKVVIDQGTHDLIIYAINSYGTYFFTLLNRDGDSYIDAFDTMMKNIQFTRQ
jgi:hypothetical protein